MKVGYAFAAAAAALVGLTGAASAAGMTEGQARHAIWGKCNNPSNLTQDNAGAWHGYCSTGPIMVDPQGQVLPESGTAQYRGMSEPQARSAILAQCGSGAGNLHADNKGNWHTYCAGKPMMVDVQGNVGPDQQGIANGLTEAHARSIAWDNCANVSALHLDAAGNWVGYCNKGALKIDPTGKISF